MIRRLLHLASALSLLAAVVVAALEIISLHGPVAAWHIQTGMAGPKGASSRFILVVNNKLVSGPYKQVRWLEIGGHKLVLANYTEPLSRQISIPSYSFNAGRRSSTFGRGQLRMVMNIAYVQAMQKRDARVYDESIFRDESGLYAWRGPASLGQLGLTTTMTRATVQSVGTTYHNSYSGGEHLFRLELPLWLVLPALLIAPAARIGLWWRRRRRLGGGRCPVCSYDLTLNVSGICPECGTPAIRDSAPKAENQK